MKMKKILLTITALLGAYAHSANAASIGPYIFDASQTASSITAASNVAATDGASSLTDLSLTTYFEGAPSNGSVSLGFSNSLFNRTGDDLAFYFLRANGEPDSAAFGLNINGSIGTDNYAASLFTYIEDGISKKYQVAFDAGYADLFIATVDLGDFGITGNDFINSLTVSDLDSTDRLALVAGFNLTAEAPVVVPVPAAIWLFITGLGALGMISRRRV